MTILKDTPNDPLTAQRCACGKLLHFGSCHFPGCHKVHIDCANKAIDEMKKIISEEGLDCNTGYAECDGDAADPICANHGRIGQWLESLGVEE